MGALRKDRAVATSAIELREVLDAALGRGNAVDAVCTGLLAACARDASVAFGSVSIVVAGFGMHPRRLDGRVLEPGNLAKRPRGFVEGEPIPSAAYVAAPRLFTTVGTALTLAGRSTYAAACAPAVASCPDDARRALLEAFAALGPALFQKRSIAEELRASLGASAGGMLVDDDFVLGAPSFEDIVVASDARFAPFAVGPLGSEQSKVEWLAARDATGLLAMASFERAEHGHEVPALGLTCPRVAVPVLRGVKRVDPTTPLGLLPPVRALLLEGQVAALEGLGGPVAALAALARGGESFDVEGACAAHAGLEAVRIAR
jgi:hypothetical protein